MNPSDIEILSNDSVPEAVRSTIAQSIVLRGEKEEQRAVDQQKLKFERVKFWLNTPIVAAIAGLLTLGATHLFDRMQSVQEATNTLTLEELRSELSESETRLKSKLSMNEAQSAAEIEALARERQFQYEIVKAQLTNPDLDNRKRAEALLFLTRAGVFSTLEEDELRRMAEAQLEDPDTTTIPLLTAAGPVIGDIETLREQAYYPIDIDNLLKQRYYNSVELTKSTFAELSTLVQQSKQFSYTRARLRHLYPTLERQLDARILSLYGRAELTSFVSSGDGETAQDIGLLALNTEHVIPQSWFDRQQPMRADLHHLFAEEPKCNSFRGRRRYGKVDRDNLSGIAEELPKCGARAGEVFEPINGKGKVARAVLYFLVRYPGKIGDDPAEHGPKDLSFLLEWSKSFPPTNYERRRNFLIYLLQGNRNPFVDYPELAEKIDFTEGFGE